MICRMLFNQKMLFNQRILFSQRMLFSQRFTRCITLSVSSIAVTTGVIAANPATAQHPPNSPSASPLLMTQASAITGSWRLVSITESALPTPMLPAPDTELTAEFAGDRLSGSGGCNRFMGGYQTESDRLSIAPLASTRMACEESVMNQETKYLTALQGAQRYEVNNQEELQIFYQTDQESGVLRFAAQSVTAQPVRGLW